MRRLARVPDSPQRQPLQGLWAMARQEGDAAPGDGADWIALPGPMTVAAGLQQAGLWSLASSSRDFDQEGWCFRCRFDAPDGAEPGQPLCLGLDGLATVASVSLNGEALLHSQNMFRQHELLLPQGVKPHGNELLIHCEPLAPVLAQRRGRPRWRTPMVPQQQLRWVRTTLLGRTPGWSPNAPAIGPWRGVWCEPLAPRRLTHLSWQAEVVDGQGRLRVALNSQDTETLRGASISVVCDEQCVQAGLQRADDGHWQAEAVVPEPALWWPHTHGRPALYQVSLHWPGGAAAQPLGQVGFRTVTLDTAQQGFGLQINGVPIFARGAVWTPPDALSLHAPGEQYQDLLQPLCAAGLNMLRVAGPMVYECPAFFEACDQLGVMVWQDLMFANMDYPGEDAAFRAEVEAEVTQQAQQWQARPSVVVVCGNSEVEQQAAMWGAPREAWSPALFHQHVPALLAEVLPGVAYWPSSAHGGALPFQPSVGTCSYYGVGAYKRPLEDAASSRLSFATEALAFANIPGDDTLATLREQSQGQAARVHGPAWKHGAPRDLGAGWDFDDVRDHYVEALYGVRADHLRAYDPARHLMLGRAAVAETMAAAFARWRSAGSVCRGALVFTLRDLRPGAGWGVLDDCGRPKSGFHGLAAVWQARSLLLTDEGLNGVTLQVVNDPAEAVAGEVELKLFRDGQVLVAEGRAPVTVAGHSVTAVPAQALLEGFLDINWAYRFGPPVANVLWACWRNEQGDVLSERMMFLPTVAGLQAQDLGLSARAEAQADGSRRVTVSTQRAARGLHFEAEGWVADYEWFDLAPAGSRTVVLRPSGPKVRAFRGLVQAINALTPAVISGGA